jgi:hypothetical protein
MPVRTIEAAFKEFTSRDDIAVVLISQQVRTVGRGGCMQGGRTQGGRTQGGRMQGGRMQEWILPCRCHISCGLLDDDGDVSGTRMHVLFRAGGEPNPDCC